MRAFGNRHASAVCSSFLRRLTVGGAPAPTVFGPSGCSVPIGVKVAPRHDIIGPAEVAVTRPVMRLWGSPRGTLSAGSSRRDAVPQQPEAAATSRSSPISKGILSSMAGCGLCNPNSQLPSEDRGPRSPGKPHN